MSTTPTQQDFRVPSSVTAIVAAAVIVGGTVTAMRIGSTDITSAKAAKLDYSVEAVAYPEDFIAVGVDGGIATDYTAAIQAAANSLAPDGGVAGGTVKLRNRRYIISSKVTLPAKVSIEGEGLPTVMTSHQESPYLGGGTVLLSAQGDAFDFLKLGHQSAVRRITFDATTDALEPSAGTVIDFTGTYGNIIEEVYINSGYVGIGSVNGAQVAQWFQIRNSAIRNLVSAGILLDYVVAGDIQNAFVMNAKSSLNKTDGVGLKLVHGTHSVNVRGCLFEEMLDDMRADGTGGNDNAVNVANIHVSGTTFDLPGRVGLAAVNMFHSSFTGCWFGGSAQTDIWLDGNTTDVAFDAIKFLGAVSSSITLASTSLNGITISNSHFSLIGSGAGNHYGIAVYAGVGHFSILGNVFRLTDPWNGGTGAMDYSVYIATGASDDYIITLNRGAGDTGGLSDGGSGENKLVTGNLW